MPPIARHMNIQVIRSTGLINWERVGENGDALLQLPEWAPPRQSLTWAPGVLHRDGEFILYYVTRCVAGGRQCISY
jgi:beta-xylosidase